MKIFEKLTVMTDTEIIYTIYTLKHINISHKCMQFNLEFLSNSTVGFSYFNPVRILYSFNLKKSSNRSILLLKEKRKFLRSKLSDKELNRIRDF